MIRYWEYARKVVNSKLSASLISLYILQISGYLIPIITLPYLSRILGVVGFGIIGISTSVIRLMVLLTDWGFSLTATQEIARHASNSTRLRQIFWDVLFARISLGLVAFIFLGISMTLIPTLRTYTPVILAATLQVIVSMLSVGWFLQGMEKMGTFAISSLAAKLIAIPLTFALVRSANDVAMATLIPGLTGLISLAVSYNAARKAIPLFPIRISAQEIFRNIISGAKIFVSTSAINLYTQSTVLILGFFTNAGEAGLYAASDRLQRASQTLYSPMSQAFFPRINNLMGYSRSRALKLMLQMLLWQGGITLLISLALFFAAPWGVPIALGRQFAPAIPVVQWLSATPFVVGVSNVFGINMLLPLGKKNSFVSIVIVSALLNLPLMFFLSKAFGAVGAAASTVITEIFVTIAMGIAVVLHLKGERKIEID